nr:MAG TPA: hypothetical protein [Caudoviricetes sp.]
MQLSYFSPLLYRVTLQTTFKMYTHSIQRG